MATALDSRLIGVGECYAHRFSTEGEFRYELSPLPMSLAAHDGDDPARCVQVTSKAGGVAQKQHEVTVKQVGTSLVVDPARVEAKVGDLVLWSADKSVTHGFRIRGRLGNEVIDSASLSDESLYSHAFGLPGRFQWRDANGSNLEGEVAVVMPDSSAMNQEEWLLQLEQGKLIQVRGDRATPKRVKVLVGQTVVWTIQGAPGVSITDAGLIS